jgi:hypothetical protein
MTTKRAESGGAPTEGVGTQEARKPAPTILEGLSVRWREEQPRKPRAGGGTTALAACDGKKPAPKVQYLVSPTHDFSLVPSARGCSI